MRENVIVMSKTASADYKIISALDEGGRIDLVQDLNTGDVLVRKRLDIYTASIYEFLKDNPVKGMPRIFSVKEFRPSFSSGEEGSDGSKYLEVIEEYIHGRTVQTILDENGFLPEAEAIDIVRQTAETVSRLHCLPEPVVHRDIKPSNIVLGSDGKAYLLDFNAAKWVDTSKAKDTHLLGTAGYAAPEQYGFKSSDMRTDVYALGVLLNVLLTGALPSEKKADGRLGGIIMKATEFNPENRFRTAHDFLNALAEYEKKVGRKAGKTAGEKESGFNNNFTEGSSEKSGGGQAWTRFLPPGFRSLKLWKCIAALSGYSMIFYVTTSLSTEGKSVAYNRVDCISMTVIFAVIILFSGNYLGIQDKIGLSKIKSVVLKVVIIAAVDFALLILAILAGGIIQMYFNL